MIIEKMNSAHVPQIAQLEKLCFSDPWSEKSIETELSCRLSLWLVALDGDKVVGYVGSQTVIDESDMMNIAVHPDYRRSGIAEKLIEAQNKGVNIKCYDCDVKVGEVKINGEVEVRL